MYLTIKFEMKQIRILKNFNFFLIYRVCLIFFIVLITYDQNYCTYMDIQNWNPSLSSRSLSITCQLEKEIRKIEKRRDRYLFSYWCTASPNFLNTKCISLSYTSFTISIVFVSRRTSTQIPILRRFQRQFLWHVNQLF